LEFPSLRPLRLCGNSFFLPFDIVAPDSYDSSSMYTCPECEQPLNQGTELCPYCGLDLTAPAAAGVIAHKKRSRTVRIIILWAVLIAAVWAIIWFVLPPRPESSKTEAEKRALATLSIVRAALISYSQASGSFPPSIEPLDASVHSAIQAAQSAGYEIQYTPADANNSGRIQSFVLLARPGNFGYRNFYTDETGAIHAASANRPATPQDPELH
jgi:RNA polymerase subunit RPABC4/transcription elongation factor Spt4